ncbi:hypothetical protein LOK49_LG04G03764 [Camellia lanceoleosa]|uniref:Uncharacterized protein n=1 Tax=Camellia lanceoleosa TaxID=1840588 RepID=A0ACC0HVP4_9ERIC|nr:hypothetical protein LOK49_LG04G03764 [Camellia lanceoleosa]
MVVVTYPSSSSLHTQTSTNPPLHLKPSPSSLLYLHQIFRIPTRPSTHKPSNSNGVLSIKAYMEDTNSVSGFARKVIGSLPVVGLVARILSDEGGLGGDTIDFAEFRRRVGKKCSVTDSKAFYEFKDRRGRKRAKLNVPTPTVSMEVRAEKALEAIYVCCFGKDPIEEEDERLLCIMLNAVFPSVGQQEMTRIVKEKARKVAEGSEEDQVPEPKPLSKEAVQLQMKDLQFLKQNSET